MKLLLIGGTGFLGRHLVEDALAHGHELTLFNRGQRNPELFAQIEQLHGNRDGDLTVLQGRRWDAVIDTCGYFPRVVRASAVALADVVEHYIFISSISVYADFSKMGLDENDPVATIQDESREDITEETYGALKALCEQAIEQTMPGRVLVIRPGLIVGPYDATDRFTYWPHRIVQGGEILVPGKPDLPVQFIDVRDLAAWTMRMVEGYRTGIYNATGPDFPLSMGQFLDESRKIIGSDAHFAWVSDAFIAQQGLELPLYAPPEFVGIGAVNCSKAIADGLTFRSLAQTIQDTLAWKANGELRTSLKPGQEQQLLQEWHKSEGTQASI